MKLMRYAILILMSMTLSLGGCATHESFESLEAHATLQQQQDEKALTTKVSPTDAESCKFDGKAFSRNAAATVLGVGMLGSVIAFDIFFAALKDHPVGFGKI